jgi:DNA-binding transcriptional regulator YiaG
MSNSPILIPPALLERTGRNSSYDPAFCALLIQHFEAHKLETTRSIVTLSDTPMGATKKQEVRAAAAKMPTFEGFGHLIRVTTRTMENWERRHPEWAEAREMARMIQKEWLMQNGASGLVSPEAFKFIATNVTDMVQKEVRETIETPAHLEDRSVEELEDARRKLVEIKRSLESGSGSDH